MSPEPSARTVSTETVGSTLLLGLRDRVDTFYPSIEVGRSEKHARSQENQHPDIKIVPALKEERPPERVTGSPVRFGEAGCRVYAPACMIS